MSPTFKLALKFFISWFFVVSTLFVLHFAIRPELWPALGKLVWGLGVVLFVLTTLMGFLATCVWAMSRFRLFDDTFWY